MPARTVTCLLILLLMATYCHVSAQHIEILQQGKHTSIRGLSVVDNQVAWISGSGENIATTTDGGQTWNWQVIKGYEKFDFRDIEAFSAKEAIIMSSGTPAVILKTIDGGTSWQEKYRNTDTAFFFDAMDFFNHNEGWILGDPINNKFLLMHTTDNGETWENYPNAPDAIKNETAFAASGTCIRVNNKTLSIVTGGNAARVLTLTPGKSKIWNYYEMPIQHGQASKGLFSIAYGKKSTILLGGDYAHDKNLDSTFCHIKANTTFENIVRPAVNKAGFQSCIEFIHDDTFVSTGTPGSNLTTDGGQTWVNIDDKSYNVCCKAKHGTLVLFAGNGGKIGVLKL